MKMKYFCFLMTIAKKTAKKAQYHSYFLQKTHPIPPHPRLLVAVSDPDGPALHGTADGVLGAPLFRNATIVLREASFTPIFSFARLDPNEGECLPFNCFTKRTVFTVCSSSM